MQRRHLLNTLLSLAALALPALTALPTWAQDGWPAKPVKLISPFPAGGTSNVMARIVAEALGKDLSQQVIVENIGGAGSTVGTLRASKAAADGYTLIQTGVGQNAVAHGPGACRTWGVEAKFGPSEDSFCRICRPIA